MLLTAVTAVTAALVLAVQAIVKVKAEGGEESKVKGVTKEGVEEPVTVADTNSNNVSVTC